MNKENYNILIELITKELSKYGLSNINPKNVRKTTQIRGLIDIAIEGDRGWVENWVIPLNVRDYLIKNKYIYNDCRIEKINNNKL